MQTQTKLRTEISSDDFKQLKPDEKLNTIYRTLITQQKNCDLVCEENNKRFGKLEKRKLKDTGLATMMGAVAGLLGGILKTRF